MFRCHRRIIPKAYLRKKGKYQEHIFVASPTATISFITEAVLSQVF